MTEASNETRIVTSQEAQMLRASAVRMPLVDWRRDAFLDGNARLSAASRDLAETVATEPDRIRAAVVEALRRFNDEYDGDALMLADAIENGADL